MTQFFKNLLHRFLDETSGSVAVEAALILPLLTTWYAGSYVFYDVFKAENASVETAYTLGDILSRQTEIDNDYIDGLRKLADFLTYSQSQPWIRVSNIEYTKDDGYSVDWSYATDDRDPLLTTDIYDDDLDDKYLPVMSDGETVILTETYIAYTPAFNVGISARTFTSFVVTAPRFTSKLVNSDF